MATPLENFLLVYQMAPELGEAEVERMLSVDREKAKIGLKDLLKDQLITGLKDDEFDWLKFVNSPYSPLLDSSSDQIQARDFIIRNVWKVLFPNEPAPMESTSGK